MYSLWQILILLFGVVISLQAVPPVLNYAGQVAVNGEAFDGNGLFKFALVNTDGNVTYWSNDGTSVDGSEPQASVSVPVNGGLYSILLGNTAQQGMGAIDPAVFAQHTDAKLRVWFSDGVNGFQQLSPDRPFASVPYAFNSESAKTAETAMAVQTGAITQQMLNNDVLSDLNRTVNHNDLSPQIKADINATIGMNRLSTEVTEKLNQEKTTTNYNAPSVGSLLAVPYGSDAPAGYSLYQSGTPKELVWEEKAPVSVARMAFDGVEVLDGKIYFVGGKDGSNAKNIVERYDPSTNTWETLNSMSAARQGLASSVLNGKLYAIGGVNLKTVEIYDPLTESWSAGVALPSEVNTGTAITVDDKIYLIGGRNASYQNINQVLCFDPSTNQWQAKANMPTTRYAAKLVWFENRIWAIGGSDGRPSNQVKSYNPSDNSWQTETFLTSIRNCPIAWVTSGKIFVAGGSNGSFLNSIEIYDPRTKKWSNAGNLPENKYAADAVVLNEKVFVIAGQAASGVFSKKVYAADLNASMEGVYDLYRKDGDAPVGTPVVQSEYADGSVTASKMAEGSVSKSALDATILKYLKPEITSQPQAQTVYGDSNVSFSVTAEGKYLSFQWKKDGVDLAGETNATFNITDANATLHDGNYSVVVSNDFGSVESPEIPVDVNTTWSTDGLVGWWKFDEGSGTIAYDSSGNGNDGNLTGGPTWATGKIGGALSFDGADDYVSFPVKSYPLGNSASVSFWAFGGSNLPNNNALFSVGNASTSALLNIHLTWAGNYVLYFDLGNTSQQDRIKKIGTANDFKGSWQFWNISKDNVTGTMSLYKNGQVWFAETGKNAALATISELEFFRIGKKYHGLIDDVRIYDRALSAAEVQALYNMGQ